MTSTTLRARIEIRFNALPVLPSVIAKLVDLNCRDDRYPDELRALVESEPNFAVRVLSAANSAASAPEAPVLTLHGAIMRIGEQATANLLMALSVTKVFVPKDEWDRSLWVHALQVAHAARALATRLALPDVSPEEAYLCGLLHDVGRFILFQEFPLELRRIDEGDWDSPAQLVEMERAICGLTHTELGQRACDKWGVPRIVGRVVREHHDRHDTRSSTAVERLVDVIRFADFAMFPSLAPGRTGLDIQNDATAGPILARRLPAGMSASGAELLEVCRRAKAESKFALDAIGIHS